TGVQQWKGARPMLPDGPPVIGQSGVPGVWLNLGHGSSGWALSCGSARVLGDLIAGQDPGVDIKRIPVCLSSHAAVDAVAHLVATHGLDVSAIESIDCDVPPIVRKNLVYDRPQTVQQSQFSMPYAMAVSLVCGTLKLEHLDAKWLAHGRIAALMARVRMHTGERWTDPALRKAAPEGAHVRVTVADGRSFELFRATARGSIAWPLTTEELADKFLDCAAPVIGRDSAQSLLDRLNKLDDAVPAAALFDGHIQYPVAT
ncbi:MAG: FAD-dependent oxidoreductase, partial [Comamonadaceae bacterium]